MKKHYALLVAFLVLFTSHAKASPVMGRGVICDSALQVEQYIALQGGDAALAVINAKAKNACALLLVAFEKGTVVKKLGNQEITEILVIAYNDGHQWVPVEPLPQFTVFVKPGQEV